MVLSFFRKFCHKVKCLVKYLLSKLRRWGPVLSNSLVLGIMAGVFCMLPDFAVKNPVMWVLIFSSYRWGNWGPESRSVTYPRIKQQFVSAGAGIRSCPFVDKAPLFPSYFLILKPSRGALLPLILSLPSSYKSADVCLPMKTQAKCWLSVNLATGSFSKFSGNCSTLRQRG